MEEKERDVEGNLIEHSGKAGRNRYIILSAKKKFLFERTGYIMTKKEKAIELHNKKYN